MPIDPSIPLQVRPPQFGQQDMSGDFLRALQIKAQMDNQRQERDIRQQELGLRKSEAADVHALNQQKIDADQRLVAVKNASNQAFKDATVTDPTTGKTSIDTDKYQARMNDLGFGADADATRKAETHSFLEDQKTSLANESARVGALGSLAASIASAPPDQQPALLQAGISRAVQSGYLPAEVGQKIASMPPGPQLQATLMQFADQAKSAKDQTEQALAASKAAQEKLKSAADIKQSDAAAASSTAEADTRRRGNAASILASAKNATQYGNLLKQIPKDMQSVFPAADEFDPASTPAMVRQIGMSPDQAATSALNEKKEANQITETELANKVAAGKAPGATAAQIAEGQQAEIALTRLDQSKRASRPVTTLNMPVSGTVDAPSTSAQEVANYRMDLTKALPYRTPPVERDKFIQQVKKVNPDWDEKNYQTFQKTENDATTGKIGTQATALNTMMGHLSVLSNAADALKNGNVQILNRLANSLGAQTGSTPITTYNTIVHRLGPEISKAYVAGGGSAGERGANEEDFDAKLGADQIKKNIEISAVLADSKIKSLEDQYQRGTYGRGKQKLLTEEAQTTRQRLAGQSSQGTVSVTDPKGGVHIFPDQASADAFKKAAGIK